MQKMTPDEMRRFVRHGTRTGKVATVRADGRPHVAPIWFELDDETGDLVFTTWHESVKAATLQRDGRASLCVDDETPPFAFVIVEGTVSISTDPEEMLTWATRIGGRYMGAERAAEYGARNGVPGELLVRLTPQKWIGRKEVAV